MGLFDGLTDMISNVAGNATGDIAGNLGESVANGTEPLQSQAGDVLSQGQDGLNGAADGIQEAIPGQLDDQLIDGAQGNLQDQITSITDMFGGK